ncbi:hypothetical protein [Halalkalibacter oceani]|uniref:hypothetical protein n=1 Tax=Halalkalibacter oceani TaxID=1653776 RepID=UPI0033914A68
MPILQDEGIRKLAQRFIFLPLARRVFEQDRLKVEQANFKIPSLYTELIDNAISKITTDLRDLRKEMRRTGLSVYEQEAGYLLVCKRYQLEVSYTPDSMRRHVGELMQQYLK